MPNNPFVTNYIAAHANEYGSYAKALGLPSTAAIGAMSAVAQEMETVYGNIFVIRVPISNLENLKDYFLDTAPIVTIGLNPAMEVTYRHLRYILTRI